MTLLSGVLLDPGVAEATESVKGEIIIAVAAVVAAGIAAGVAVWRMRRELEHDREMRLLDELRLLVDEAGKQLAESNERIDDARVLVVALGNSPVQLRGAGTPRTALIPAD